MTNHGRDSIKRALRELACAAGLQHNDWFNPGSSWYGPARRVRSLARITVALYKFGRAHMFGPGTACRWGAPRARCSEQVQCPGAPPATPCPRSAPGGSGPTPAPCCSTCRRSPLTGACCCRAPPWPRPEPAPGVQGAEPAGVGGPARGSPGPGGHRHRAQRVWGGAAALHVGATTACMMHGQQRPLSNQIMNE